MEGSGAVIRTHSFLERSLVNGPGERSVLWVQGCHLDCSGCFNKASHDRAGGCDRGIDEILACVPRDVRGLSISGGEPFLQAKACADLCVKCRARGLDILVYSGMVYEDIVARGDPDSLRLLRNLDYLIDGPYKEAEAARHPWAGSGNQRVLCLEQGLVKSELVGTELFSAGAYTQSEITIASDGTIIYTGFQ